jgi:hypothetical protein
MNAIFNISGNNGRFSGFGGYFYFYFFMTDLPEARER